jgi:hypothetical protein
VPVEVKVLAMRNGRWLMAPVGAQTSATDDRGMYRMSGLVPGEYYVRADPSRSLSARGREGWQRTYFPAATDPAGTAPVAVAAGANLTDRDITIQSLPTYSISGTVDKQLSTDERFSAALSFWVVRADASVDDDPFLRENIRRLPPFNATHPSDFELTGIPSGVYDLYPMIPGVLPLRDQQYGLRAYTGRTRVKVVDRDLTGIRAVVRRGVDVRLREVSRARAATPPPPRGSIEDRVLERQQLSLSPKEPLFVAASREGGPGVRPDAAGIFTVPNVTEGLYDVEPHYAYPYPAGEYLADIRQAGKSILESGVTITQQTPALIDVVFEPGGATLNGTVRDAGNRPTFDRVVVLLSRASGRRRALYSRTVRANAAGAYSFTNIAPGDYLVFAATTIRDWNNESDLVVRTLATRARSVTIRRGATLTVSVDVLDTSTLPPPSASRPPSVSKSAAAAPAPATAVAAPAKEGGVIVGRVLDADGAPVRGAKVVALKPQFTYGERDFSSVVFPVETNDLGEFRLFWLPPGMYYLAATPPAVWNGRALPLYSQTAATTFYPGVRHASEALRLEVAAGETRADVLLPRTSGAYLVSGDLTVVPASPSAGSESFYLIPRAAVSRHASWLQFPYPGFNVRRSGAGFTLSNVLSSSYDLYITGPGNLTARVPLTVDGQNVTGVVATLAPNPTLTLRVTVDGSAAKTAPQLHALDPLPSIPGSSPTGDQRGGGLFAFTALEGRYRLEVRDYSSSAYVADIREGDTSILAQGIVARRPAPESIDVIVRTDGGTIAGTITAGRRPRRATVVLAPSPEQRHLGVLYRTVDTEADGSFRLPGIAPGNYFVFLMNEDDWAIDELSRIAARHESDARAVTVSPRSFQQIQLQSPE